MADCKQVPAFVLALLFGLGCAGRAHAEDKLTLTGPEKTAQVELDRDAGGEMTGTMRFVVATSKKLSAPLNVRVFLDATGEESDLTCTGTKAAMADITDGPKSLPANQPTAATVKLTLDRRCADRQGTLAVSTTSDADAGISAATVRFAPVRGLEGDPEYANALGTAALLALAALVLMILPYHFLYAKVRPGWATASLPIDVPWSPKDSWVTNITALGAVLGVVLATTGALQQWLPGISLSPFLTLNLLFGEMILFAPVVYSASCTYALHKGTDGTKLKATGHDWGLVTSAWITLGGVYGQLATIAAMAIAAHANRGIKVFLCCCLGAAAVAVGAYAVMFVRGTLAAALAHTPPAASTSRDIRIRNNAALRFPQDTALPRHDPAPPAMSATPPTSAAL